MVQRSCSRLVGRLKIIIKSYVPWSQVWHLYWWTPSLLLSKCLLQWSRLWWWWPTDNPLRQKPLKLDCHHYNWLCLISAGYLVCMRMRQSPCVCVSNAWLLQPKSITSVPPSSFTLYLSLSISLLSLPPGPPSHGCSPHSPSEWQ